MVTAPPRSAPAPDAVGIAAAVRAGARSAAELCETALRSADRHPEIFWALDGDGARANARRVDEAIRVGRVDGPLAGVPVAVKDNYDVAGLPTRLGLREPVHIAAADAEAVVRLRAAGAIVIGKTAMDQLAWSMTGQAPGYPEAANPVASGRITGGSSGGSAAAVAAEVVPLALGSDSAGSVRVPAAWCGLIGFKPTHGLVSLRGVAPMAPSLDTAGILARSARDCETALAVLAEVAPDTRSRKPGSPIRCAVFDGGPAWFAAGWERLASDREWCCDAEFDALPPVRLGQILASELAGAWGGLPDVLPDVRAGLQRGAALDPAAVQRDRAALAAAERAARSLFAGRVRLLVLPAVPGPAPLIGELGSVADASRYTRTLGAFGWPSASVPCGTADRAPVGLQLVAAPGDDAWLLHCLSRVGAAQGDHG